MPARPYIECSVCDEPKPIHRKLSLTDAQGLLIDEASFCRACWNDIHGSVEDASGLIDRRRED
ncbi:MAG TPA: hypothetical protein PKW45_11620 [Bryobacteraceae bacterium]|nr:hypothetical protein [Bryobacteraceae bacterium]